MTNDDNDSLNNSVEPTIITRDYDAPLSLMFEAWTQAEHIQKWQVPFKGFSFEYLHADVKAGGSSLHKMASPNGFEMYLLTKYEAITPPDTIVFRQYNANEAGEIIPSPNNPNWPRELRTTIKLEALAENKTRLQLIWQPIAPSEAEIAVFEASRGEHHKGWGAGLEQLAEYFKALVN